MIRKLYCHNDIVGHSSKSIKLKKKKKKVNRFIYSFCVKPFRTTRNTNEYAYAQQNLNDKCFTTIVLNLASFKNWGEMVYCEQVGNKHIKN